MTRNKTVLVVDDNLQFTGDLQTALGVNYETLVARNMTEAQRMAMSSRPGVVVLGMIKPRGSAFLLHKWFKNLPAFRDIPHVVVDAPYEKQLTMGWRRDEGLQMEAEEYFLRPVQSGVLVQLVEKFLDRETQKIKVLVADDHAMVREGISALLNLQKDIHIVGEAVDGQEAVDKTLQLQPDVVLMDIVMPGMNGLEATRQISRKCKENVKVLMLSQYDDEQNVKASSEAGAVGFIPKKSVSSKLLAAIRAVSLGERLSMVS